MQVSPLPTMPQAVAPPSQEDRLMAVACHLGTLLGLWYVVPLVMYLTQRERSGFVARHALQALFLQLLSLVATVVAVGVVVLGVVVGAAVGLVASNPTEALLAFGLLTWVAIVVGVALPGLVYTVAMIAGSIESWQGREAGLPIVGALARSIHGRP